MRGTRQEELMRDKGNKEKNANRRLLPVMYVFLLIFLGMAGFLAYTIHEKGDAYARSPYNTRRQRLFEERNLRGSILAADGELLAQSGELPEGELRIYPYAELFAHVVGYTQKGITGIESAANDRLVLSHLSIDKQFVYMLKEQKIPGDVACTTLQPKLQQTAGDAMQGCRGAVIATDPTTGAILAMVSLPDYNPNSLLEDWEWLNGEESEASRLLNRATRGQYTPGSVFKLITATAFLRQLPQEAEAFSYTCTGTYEADGYTIRCAGGQAHGTVAFSEAFAVSCNGAFAEIGRRLGAQALADTCRSLGFREEPLHAELPILPGRLALTEDSGLWELLQTSFGQGKTVISPMHVHMLTSAIAANGALMTPYVVDRLETADGRLLERYLPELQEELFSADEAARLQQMMRQVVVSGTAEKLQTQDYEAFGKTGTAQVSSEKEDHSWFTGYAISPQGRTLAVTVLLEEVGSKGIKAVDVAKTVFDSYLCS